MKKFYGIKLSELSHFMGVGVGFLNFYVLYYSWDFSWETSFAVAFVLGCLFSGVFNHYVGNEFDKREAEKISEAVEEFEDKPRS